MNTAADPAFPVDAALLQRVQTALEQLTDPEIPVVTLADMGILRAVRPDADDPAAVEVVITPTYSGCPAMAQIEDDVRATLQRLGVRGRVTTQLAPPWTTDWMSEAARAKLRAYGIAPPGRCPGPASPPEQVLRFVPAPAEPVACPRCGSTRTREVSRFGSTACKALWQCLDCREPFDHFKPH
ncbi:MAG: 1,2-phenylacetyl-CoA epoxidase subunit PaaD [Tepidimonas sp.]|uniref:1,2-phenylacetyl-CoA epoxidase subunit PaaD n=1 Tax=Tepidimonas sp. TaxID=2002775 RepID=UPI00298ED2C7|nr:1,2-phenylacetyl-CoA epoxidase subunit PaaD [Tepidimonas sp.]MCS6809809.1 phenylacetate-CoA oxygenase subunit PaaJ [Tepidimonas sp.]MDW8336708.1 1,2-phenylacetyl-CoA epoxidase subunit PaaD [Tepidimonas sp.]